MRQTHAERYRALDESSNLASDLTKKYSSQSVQIKYAKYKDLMSKVVEKGVLPEEFVDYYRDLPHDGPADVNGNDDENDPDDYVYE